MKSTLNSIVKYAESLIIGALCMALAWAVLFLGFHRDIGDFLARNQEISAGAYIELSGLASKSCSGPTVLKDIIGKGPINGADFQKISDGLKRLAEARETQEVRAKIINTTVSCV